MELRHAADQRLHYDDVIRAFPLVPSSTELRVSEARALVPGAEGTTAQEGRTLVGYPIVFDTWTEIDSWEGKFLERLAPGSADKTLDKRSDKIQLMFNHGFDFTLEQTPIGRHTVFTPEARGVWNEAALVDRGVYEKVDLVVELIRMGAIYGQSFRFSVMAEEWVDEPVVSKDNPKGLPERTITEFRYYESGPVTYPAYEATTVSLRDGEPFAVRSAHEMKLWCESRNQPVTVAETIQAVEARRSSNAATIARVTRSTAVIELQQFISQAS